MAPPGTRAVVYEDPKTRRSWAPRGLDAWYCGPVFDHYRNMKFFVPETGGHRNSGSFDLFPQHCLLPTLNPTQHVEAVHNELRESIMALPKKQRQHLQKAIIKSLATIEMDLQPPQRVATEGGEPDEQRVATDVATEAPPVTTTTNPTNSRVMAAKPRTHLRDTRANTPGTTPDINSPTTRNRRSTRINPTVMAVQEPTTPNCNRIPLYHPNMISQEAINFVTESVHGTNMDIWTPEVFMTADTSSSHGTSNHDADLEHFCAPVVHPETGETITSYKKLQRNPVMKKIWTKAFGKEFGSLAQGDDLTKTPGTNTLFVLDHEQIKNIPSDRTITYARIVVDF